MHVRQAEWVEPRGPKKRRLIGGGLFEVAELREPSQGHRSEASSRGFNPKGGGPTEGTESRGSIQGAERKGGRFERGDPAEGSDTSGVIVGSRADGADGAEARGSIRGGKFQGDRSKMVDLTGPSWLDRVGREEPRGAI